MGYHKVGIYIAVSILFLCLIWTSSVSPYGAPYGGQYGATYKLYMELDMELEMQLNMDRHVELHMLHMEPN